jgi:hypothetical protein
MKYLLIQTNNGLKPCISHKRENIVDVFNSGNWDMQCVDIDKLKFTCSKCQAERVYKKLTEKTILANDN